MPKPPRNTKAAEFGDLVEGNPTPQEQQIAELQEDLARERDARLEERFVGIVILVVLLDIVFLRHQLRTDGMGWWQHEVAQWTQAGLAGAARKTWQSRYLI